MTPFEQFLENLVSLSPWGVVKLGFLIFLIVYIVFAGMVIRQVELMIRTLDGSINLPLKILAYIHLIFATFIFLLALIIL